MARMSPAEKKALTDAHLDQIRKILARNSDSNYWWYIHLHRETFLQTMTVMRPPKTKKNSGNANE